MRSHRHPQHSLERRDLLPQLAQLLLCLVQLGALVASRGARVLERLARSRQLSLGVPEQATGGAWSGSHERSVRALLALLRARVVLAIAGLIGGQTNVLSAACN